MIEYIDELPQTKGRGKGFVKNIMDEFLASGKDYAKLSIEGRTGRQLYNTLYAYLRNHADIPVNPHVRSGECYLERLY